MYRLARATAVCAVALTATTLLTVPAFAQDTPTVALSDTFDGSSLDLSKWQYTLGTDYPGGPPQFGTWEIQTNTDLPENVSVHDGSLYITPTKGADGKWKSARVESVSTEFKPAEGSTMTTEFRAALPDVTEANGSGYWPALWMNAATYRDDRMSWPMGGEFDIAESVSGGQWSNSVLHCGKHAPDSWGGPCNEPSGINAGSVPLPGAWGSFNTYSFQWDRSKGAGNDELRWYQNGALTQTVKQSDIPAEQWGTLSGHRGFHILMNVSIDGAYPDAKKLLSNANTEPGHAMRVDSVEVTYSAGGAEAPPVVTPEPAPETPEPAPAPAPETPAPAPAPEDGNLLVAAGDSFTAGDAVGKDNAYPAVAGTELGYEVQNVAVNGAKSSVLAEQLAGTDADVVVFTTGGNDINALQAIGGGEAEALAKLPALQESLTTTFTEVADSAPKVYVVTYAQIIGSCVPAAAAALSALNDTIEAAAVTAGIGVIDAEPALTGHTACDTNSWVANGHPTAEGQAAIGHLVAQAIGTPDTAPVPVPEESPVDDTEWFHELWLEYGDRILELAGASQ